MTRHGLTVSRGTGRRSILLSSSVAGDEAARKPPRPSPRSTGGSAAPPTRRCTCGNGHRGVLRVRARSARQAHRGSLDQVKQSVASPNDRRASPSLRPVQAGKRACRKCYGHLPMHRRDRPARSREVVVAAEKRNRRRGEGAEAEEEFGPDPVEAEKDCSPSSPPQGCGRGNDQDRPRQKVAGPPEKAAEIWSSSWRRDLDHRNSLRDTVANSVTGAQVMHSSFVPAECPAGIPGHVPGQREIRSGRQAHQAKRKLRRTMKIAMRSKAQKRLQAIGRKRTCDPHQGNNREMSIGEAKARARRGMSRPTCA